MFSRRKRQAGPKGAVPSDAQVAEEMKDFADIFVRGSAEEGQHFDFTIDSAHRLDALVDLFVEGRPGRDVIQSMVLSMGAFVGELIVCNGGGRWTYEPRAGSPMIELASGLGCFPLNKVGKRITVGPEHSIAQFVDVALSGQLPPDATPAIPPAG